MEEEGVRTVTSTKYFAPALSNRSNQLLAFHLDAVKLVIKSS